MKRSIFTAVFSVMVLAGCSEQNEKFTFQGLPWGSTQEQVIEKLGQDDYDYSDDGEYLAYYDVVVSGYKADLSILFAEGGMVLAEYELGGFNTVPDILQAYETLRNQLQEKYGQPIAAKGVTSDNLPEEDFFLQPGNTFLAWKYLDTYIFLSADMFFTWFSIKLECICESEWEERGWIDLDVHRLLEFEL